MELTAKNIRLGAQATDKREAIEAVGKVLVEAGNIAPGYVQSMFGREAQANTFLGRGIAIPHGMPQDRELIHQTGIAVVQIPSGVAWNDGEIVNLVVGIAAKSDEHLAILAGLMDVLDDGDTAEKLAHTNDVNEIIAALTRTPSPDASTPMESAGGQSIEVHLMEGSGLHARPATMFVEIASRFDSEISVEYNGKTANGKAMASLLRLAVEGGAAMRIRADGLDAAEALQTLREGVESGLGDEAPTATAPVAPGWTPVSGGHSLTGVAASPGLAIGPLHHFRASRVVVRDENGDAAEEAARLQSALEIAHSQLEDVANSVAHSADENNAVSDNSAIFRAHQAFLEDPDLKSETEVLIKAGHSAAWSWQTAIEARVVEMRAGKNALLAERATDLHDVGQRVLRVLSGVEETASTLPDEPVILVADDLTPSDTARLDPRRVLGLCTALGGPTSHTAIIARSLDIPAIVGAGAALLESEAGGTCILDGNAGVLYLQPNEADLESAREFAADLGRRRDEEHETRYQPAFFTDGHRVEITANIGKASDSAVAVEAGAEGIGLLRTEFLFLERETAPTEEEQFAALTEMTRALNGLPLIVRTLDIGGDKVLPYLPQTPEDNPFLGVRGLRLCLRKPELFEPQLRAIYRAACEAPVKIMFPMVSNLSELREAKAIAERIRLEVDAPVVEIGIMIEVPSAALMAREFAREVDFFSVGTNDLTQYTLAMDRLHPILGKNADGLHPAVLRLIETTVRAADEAGKWVGVCGGVAGEPRGALILAGMGVTELSMSIPAVAAVKATLRRVSHADARRLATRALACESAEEVRALVLPQ